MDNMVNNHRVYSLAGPQVRLTIAIDLETTAADALTTAADSLSALIATAEQSGKDTSKAKAKLADLRTAVEQARSSIAGRADTLLAIRPSSDTKALKTERQRGAQRREQRKDQAEGSERRCQEHPRHDQVIMAVARSSRECVTPRNAS